ncbi:GNAT family N-acetyltransferase [Bacillus swezeyi]|uniref:GNAT family N-acetyltransferase n=1 Tax=Bacillus swezeyi TaxID=1925020 RepID=UPI001CC24216|nr:GNAT family N-acetyltransferase [Bacillus swezeyi]
MEETEINVRQAQADFILRKDLRMCIFHKETGEWIGCTALHRMKWEAKRFQIGYWCHSEFAGQGYMTEALLISPDAISMKNGLKYAVTA